MLPDTIDPATVRTVLLIGLALVVIGILLTVRFVTKMGMRVAFVAVLAVAGVALWAQRAELSECADTGRCTFFGRDVEVPDRS